MSSLCIVSPDENPGDPGTTAGGLIERTLNIGCANEFVKAMQRSGHAVEFNQAQTYVQRVAEANAKNATCLIAFAHNAASSPAPEGLTGIFCNAAAHTIGKQQALYQAVARELLAAGIVQHATTYDEQVYECCAFNNDTGYFEIGFQTNAFDNTEERSAGYFHAVGEAVCRGVCTTYGLTYVPELAGGSGGQVIPITTTTGDDEMLYVGAVHPLVANLRAFVAGSAYRDPATGALIAHPLAAGATVSVTGYRYTTSPVQSTDLGNGQEGPDPIWWHALDGSWVPDAILDTTGVAGAPAAAAGLPASEQLSTYFTTTAVATVPDDDSALSTAVQAATTAAQAAQSAAAAAQASAGKIEAAVTKAAAELASA